MSTPANMPRQRAATIEAEASHPTATATRRGKRGGRFCRRPRCGQPRQVTQLRREEFCSVLCKAIDADMRKAQRVCEATGPSPAAGELWASVVELADSLTRYQAADRELLETARSRHLAGDQSG